MNKLIISLLLISISLGSYGQQYQLKNISWNDGLLSNEVTDIIEDEEGYIWLAGNEDLVKYDGNIIHSLTMENGQPFKRVFDIHISNTNLWIATADTCLILVLDKNSKDPKYVYFNEIQQPTIIIESNHIIYIYSPLSNTVYSIDQNGVKQYMALNKILYDNTATCLLHNNNTLFVGTRDNGLYVIGNNNFKNITKNEGLHSNTVNSLILINEELLISHDSAISILSKGKLSNFAQKDEFRSVKSIHYAPDKSLIVSTNNGIYKYQGRTLINKIDKHNNLLGSSNFTKTYVDKSNNYWFASQTNGVYILPNYNLTRYSNINMEIDPVYGITQDKSGKFWFGHYGGESYLNSMSFENEIPVQKDTMRHLKADPFLNVYIPPKDEVWFVGWNGTNKISNGKISTYTEIYEKTQFNNIHYNKYDSAIYLASGYGVFKQVNDKLFEISSTIDSSNILCNANKIASSKHGIYVGSAYGLKKIIKSQLVDIPGLSNKQYRIVDVNSIITDEMDAVWADIGFNRIIKIFSTDKGDNQYKIYNLNYLLKLNGPYNFCSNQKYFALRTFGEVYIWDLKSIHDEKPVLINKLNANDGFKAETPYFSEMYFDHNNNLWICGAYGAYKYNFLTDVANKQETYNHLTYIQINNDSIDLTPYSTGISDIDNLPIDLRLPINKNEISFNFMGICQKMPHEVKYRTKLIGLNSNWTSPTKSANITYNNLSPGTYTFQFISCNNDGLWNKEPYSFTFTILPAWYQTWWFKLLITVLVAIMIYGIFLWRINVIRKEKNRQIKLTQDILESQEQERKRLAQDLHDGVGQELSMLKVNIEKLQNLPISEKVNKIIEDIRFLSRNIHPHYFEKLGLTKAVEMIVEENNKMGKITWIHELEPIDEYFSTKQQLMVYRIIQECMNNIIKHSGAKNAKVSFDNRASDIQIFIQDNGVGFNVNSEKLDSLGLSTIRERVRSLNGMLNITSKPGQGVKTEIILPKNLNK